MPSGGRRPGAGAKPGPRISEDKKRVQKSFRLDPNVAKILESKDNASRHIDKLVIEHESK